MAKKKPKPQKLDSLSKIILATGAINYMAAGIDSVNEQIKMIQPPADMKDVFADGIKGRDAVLAKAVKQLAQVMEDLGNYMNNNDCLCPLDVRVTEDAFNVIIGGQDDPEE